MGKLRNKSTGSVRAIGNKLFKYIQGLVGEQGTCMNKRKIGKDYENQAEKYLESYGFRILERNFRVRQGEIDIIGYHKGILVFVEVKYRKDEKKGLPEEAITLKKQRQICKVAEFYLMRHPLKEGVSCRYDVVAICGEKICWYENAFSHIGRR